MTDGAKGLASVAPGDDRPASAVAEISREIVKAHAHYYGRGPTKARTVWKDDLVVVILEEIFTRAEQTLVTSGHFNEVRATRQAFQDESESLFRQIIEQSTGRQVRSFLSQVNPDGVVAEVFLLVRLEENGRRGRAGPPQA